MPTLKSLVDETTEIKNELVNYYNNLKNILAIKGVESSNEDKLSSLIDKVNSIVAYPDIYLYKDGKEYLENFDGFVMSNHPSLIASEKREDSLYIEAISNRPSDYVYPDFFLGGNIPNPDKKYTKFCVEIDFESTNAWPTNKLGITSGVTNKTYISSKAYSGGKFMLNREVLEFSIYNLNSFAFYISMSAYGYDPTKLTIRKCWLSI